LTPSRYILYNLILFLLFVSSSICQDLDEDDTYKDFLDFEKSQYDSLSLYDSLMFSDSLKLDSLKVSNTPKKSSSGLDTTLSYKAKDTVVMYVKQKRMTLKGEAFIDYKGQKLSAENLDIDFDQSALYATPGLDSSNKEFGFPAFNDNGEEFMGKNIKYNFKNQKGLISLGETQLDEGFYFGTKIKRVSQDVMYIQDGFYTACDNPIPDYHFGSSQMKMIAGDKIFLDPAVFYIEEMPVFAIPFGLFFATESGRKSGIIVPSFFFSRDRGVVFQDLGFYWAASDYFDSQFGVDFFTKGGYLLKNRSQWVLKDVHSGNMQLELGRTRFNTNEQFVQAWKFALTHNHTITPQDRINANMNFTSADYNRNTSVNMAARIQQNIFSSASYQKNFDNGGSFSIAFNRNQNIIDDSYDQSLPITYTMPNTTLAKAFNSKFFKPLGQDINFTYRGAASYGNDKRISVSQSDPSDPFSPLDTNFTFNERSSITHTPSITYNFPRLFRVLTFTPTINIRANNFFRRMTRTWNSEEQQVETSFERGLFTEYHYDYGMTMRTRLFGIWDEKNKLMGFIKPNILGIKAFRHTMEPILTYNISPDFSDPNLGFYDSYFDEVQEREVQYSRFELDGGTRASNRLSQSLNFNLQNKFEMKVAQGDSLPDKNIELMMLTMSTGYDFTREEFNFQDLNFNMRSNAINALNFNASVRATLYDEEYVYNERTDRFTSQRVNRFLIENSNTLARVTSLTIGLSTQIAQGGAGFTDSQFGEEEDDLLSQDSLDTETLGSRFSRKMNYEYQEPDWFGERTHGYTDINMPWSVNLGVNYSYASPNRLQKQETLNINAMMNFDLTESWHFQTSLNYDFIRKELNAPTVNITKDLHCWELTARWNPTGFNKGFYLRFGLKASQLRDLQYEKRSGPLF